MPGSQKRNIEQVDQQIIRYRKSINDSEANILTQLSRSPSPLKQKGPSLTELSSARESINTGSPQSQKTADKTTYSQSLSDADLTEYIKSMKNMQNALEQKINLIEINFEKQRLSMEYQISLLSQDGSHNQKGQQKNASTIKMLQNQLKQLQSSLQAKSKQATILNQQLSHYRKDIVAVKQQNKRYKADNKIIMNQLDRLSEQTVTPRQRQKAMQEREIRVMKSLYQDASALEQQQRKYQNQQESTSDLTNRKKLDEASNTNAELKSVIRRLNQQVSLLKAQKALLSDQNSHLSTQLQNQKDISSLSEQSNQKLNGIIQKMGDKLFNIQQINETLRQSLLKQDNGPVESYYTGLKTKAGQFYYKR